MIKFEGNIVQFGFGAVGKSFFEKLPKEIDYNENKYFVITRDNYEFQAYVNLGGIVANFITADINKENFAEIFGKYLKEGDLLIDFADTVGTRDICNWCAENNIMYLNTGEADWPENWYSIFNENELKKELREKHKQSSNTNKYPIVLQHGNNPGLVSYFVKEGIEYIAKTQYKHNKELKNFIKNKQYNEAARLLNIKQIHVNDIDLQEVKGDNNDDTLFSTWCTDSFWFEMLSEATMNFGTHEQIDFEDECNLVNKEKGYIEFKNLAADRRCRTYYPNGPFEGFLVPHEETITIAQNLEVIENGKSVYRPSTMFIYQPCDYAVNYFNKAKVNEYPNPDSEKPQDSEDPAGKIIIRGYEYPSKAEILYQEKISSGTEYVGVLLIGEKFKPVWVGNRIEPEFLYKNKKDSYWQTPTITPVAMSALAGVCWILKNKDKGGIYFPDDIPEHKGILKMAEKYISKTIYKTLKKDDLEASMKIDFSNLQTKDIFVK